MNVSCTACPAKYAVPDDRVRGKKARITCKRCGTVIVIDGTTEEGRGAESAPAPSLPTPSIPAASLTPTSTAPAAEWLVAINDEHQEPATLERIVELYAEGSIDAETFVWREGMPEWRTPFEIPEVAAALRARGLEHNLFESGPASSPKELYPDDEATNVARPAMQAAAFRDSAPRPADEPSDEDRTVFRRSEPAASSSPLPSPRPAEDESLGVPLPTALDLGFPPPVDEEPTIARSSAFADLEGFPSIETGESAGSKPPSLSPRAESTSVSELAARAFERASSEPPPDSRPSLLGRSRASAPGEAGPSSRRRAVRSSQTLSARLGGTSELGPLPAGGRAERRPKTGDLFARQAEAGGENDPALRPSRPPSSHPPSSQPTNEEGDPGQAGRLTGARNETSVLFTLDALIQSENAPSAKARSPREAEAELLIGAATPPSAIANLGTTGVATLVAPDLTAPVRAVPDPVMFPGEYDLTGAPRRRRPLLIGGLLIAAAGVGAGAAMVLPNLLSSEPPAAATTASAPSAPAATPSEPEKAAAPTPSASASDAPTSAASAATASAAPERATPPAAAAPPAARPTPSEPADRPKATPTPTPQANAPKPEEPAASAAPPFDQVAAKTALVAAANTAANCKQPGGPTGTGRALVTFAPSGRVTKTEVTGDFAGTAVGSCVARVFRNAKVPAFSGDAITVAKSFSIE